jgi:hypothetical protein
MIKVIKNPENYNYVGKKTTKTWLVYYNPKRAFPRSLLRKIVRLKDE